VTSDLLVVWPADFGRLICDELNSSVPFSGTYGSLNSLAKDSSLNEVLDCEIKLFL